LKTVLFASTLLLTVLAVHDEYRVFCGTVLLSGTYSIELVNDSLYEWNVKLLK